MWKCDDVDVEETALVEMFDLFQSGTRKRWSAHLLGCLHGVEECVVGDVCGGECDVMDRVLNGWRRVPVPYAVRAVSDGDGKGFNLKNV